MPTISKSKRITLNQLLLIIDKKIKKLFASENSGHDIYHLVRTKNLALRIQKNEGGDRKIIAIAAFLHDLHRIIQNKSNKYCSPEDSLSLVKKILIGTGLDKNEISSILHIIEHHEEYSFSKNGKTVRDIETLIVQDADNLDSMGAIGIARGFAYSGAYSIPIWLPQVKDSRRHYDEGMHDMSEIHHFYNKLLRLKDNMNTKTGKKIAQGRHNFMLKYLAQFFDEWKGLK